MHTLHCLTVPVLDFLNLLLFKTRDKTNKSNPTGAAATKAQLEHLIRVCKTRGSILVFDTAYGAFIRSEGVPRSIFECEGARDVAIELSSFSKYAGFTGVRLGWTVIPSGLRFSDGSPVKDDFDRIMTTGFNGASNIAQAGAMACLEKQGLLEMRALTDHYMENAKILRDCMQDLGFTVYGGTDAPYVFVKLPDSMGTSWEAFAEILDKTQVITMSGCGFGPSGEGFLRLSSFAKREFIVEACSRFQEHLRIHGDRAREEVSSRG